MQTEPRQGRFRAFEQMFANFFGADRGVDWWNIDGANALELAAQERRDL